MNDSMHTLGLIIVMLAVVALFISAAAVGNNILSTGVSHLGAVLLVIGASLVLIYKED